MPHGSNLLQIRDENQTLIFNLSKFSLKMEEINEKKHLHLNEQPGAASYIDVSELRFCF